jgi:predicted TPR repeat methyltransferase
MKPDVHRCKKLIEKAKDLLAQGREKEALAAAVKAGRADPSNADAWFLQAALHARHHDYRAVVQCCDEVIARHPDNAVALFNRGLALQSAGDTGAAVPSYREALRLKPDYVAARVNLATVLVDQGQAAEALELADAALQHAPGMTEAIGTRALALLGLGRVEEARSWLNNVIATAGESPVLLHTLARCAAAAGDPDEARMLLLRLTSVSKEFAPAWAELGRLALKREQYGEAAGYYERAAGLQPAREYRFQLAHSLYAAGRTDAAYRIYTALLEGWPDDPLVHNNLGRLYEKNGNLAGAETHYRRAVELQPGNAVARCNYGRILLGLGRAGEALQEYERAIGLDPRAFEGFHGRGQTLVDLGRSEDAIESFRAALELKPDLTDAKYYIEALGGEGVGREDRHAYVAGLFDKYAEKFESELVQGLKYETPVRLFELVQAVLPGDGGRMDTLDLGCGTGLCGPLFRPIAGTLVGVDLSGGMIEKARDKSVYDRLHVGDIVEFMAAEADSYDLIIAGDVFVYIGDLQEVFAAAYDALHGGGYFAFSVERHSGEGFIVRGSGRHAHSSSYIQELAIATGFSEVGHEECHIRLEYGRPVEGALYVFRR